MFLPSPKFTASARPAQIKTREAQLLDRAKGAGACIALADSGEQLDSIAFARLLEQLPLRGHSTIQFLIGGPHGLAGNGDCALDTTWVSKQTPGTF
jgi:23S rRNA pseudoU1915 N3-methylase RlmH